MIDDVELLAPAGDMEKLKTALHFGADAVYFAGKKFGLRAFANNFDDLSEPINYAHSFGKKAYVTVNIYARNYDLAELKDYLIYLQKLGADGIIVSDVGIMELAKSYAPKLELHISTQANTTNYMSALAYNKYFNAKRVVLARELTLDEISQIVTELNKNNIETEVFVHGAMCISYSGRCLLSNYLTNRDSNRGACVQACRFSYSLIENADNTKSAEFIKTRGENDYPIGQDEYGTYILNSKDMCMAEYLDKIIGAGVKSLKIEGRMKSPYYLGTVVNCYKRIINEIKTGKKDEGLSKVGYIKELEKCSHRKFTTGFMVDDGEIKQNYKSSHQTQSKQFVAVVKDVMVGNNEITLAVEMRNRFKLNDYLEVLSPGKAFNHQFKVTSIKLPDGTQIEDAKNVQQQYYITLQADDKKQNNLIGLILPNDILRR